MDRLQWQPDSRKHSTGEASTDLRRLPHWRKKGVHRDRPAMGTLQWPEQTTNIDLETCVSAVLLCINFLLWIGNVSCKKKGSFCQLA
jgi:hypothetical protein